MRRPSNKLWFKGAWNWLEENGFLSDDGPKEKIINEFFGFYFYEYQILEKESEN